MKLCKSLPVFAGLPAALQKSNVLVANLFATGRTGHHLERIVDSALAIVFLSFFSIYGMQTSQRKLDDLGRGSQRYAFSIAKINYLDGIWLANDGGAFRR